MVPRSPVFVVLNAGGGADDSVAVRERIVAALSSAQRRHVIFESADGQDLPQLAADAVARAVAEDGIVAAVGGDGTLNTVAQAVLGSGRPFGVLPQGTFNYFARAHGLPSEPEAAVATWLAGSVKPVQVGLVNQHAFLVNASLGLYPRVLAAREEDNRVYGRRRIVALWSALRTLWNQSHVLRLQLEADGKVLRVRTPTLFVGNNELQLEQLGFDEREAVQQQGRLAAITLRPVGAAAMVWLLLRAALGDLGRAGPVYSRAVRSLVVRAQRGPENQAMQVAYDGELRWLQAPLRFGVSPRALPLLVPPPGAAAQGAA